MHIDETVSEKSDKTFRYIGTKDSLRKRCIFVYQDFKGRRMDMTIENKQRLDKETSDKVSFISFIIPMFADAYKMDTRDAWLYLKKYGGWDFLNKHWWALHTDNVLYALNDIYEVCYKNGGQR